MSDYDYDEDYYHMDMDDHDLGLYGDMQVLKLELATLRNELQKEREQRSLQQDELKQQINQLQNDNKNLLEALDGIEIKSRKNNVIIFGVDDDNQHAEDTAREIFTSLDVHVGPDCITEAFRVGRYKGKRPIICKVSSFRKKCEIMNKNKKQGQYAILNDLTKKERHIKKELKNKVDDAKSKDLRIFVRKCEKRKTCV